MKHIILIAIVSLFFSWSGKAEAYLLVEDIPNLTHNIISQIENYAKYVQEVINQLTQITNQVTQITNQVTQLERFGDPRYYVNLLNIDQFMASAAVMTNGIGNTIATYRQLANGQAALSYTAQGLYSNLSNMVDRFGNPVNFNTQNFAKFATTQNMLEDYNTQQRTYNTQMASLQQQLTTALRNLNADKTQMGKAAYAAQITAIHAQMNALTANSTLAGQRLAAQHISNQNDAARVAEAQREQMIQERNEDLQVEANGFSLLLGGPTNPVAPDTNTPMP